MSTFRGRPRHEQPFRTCHGINPACRYPGRAEPDGAAGLPRQRAPRPEHHRLAAALDAAARAAADRRQPAVRPGAAGRLQVPDRRRDRQPQHRVADGAAARRGGRGAGPGGELVPAHAAVERAGAAPHLGAAGADSAPRAAPAGGVLRQQPDRLPGVAGDDRRRRGTQPGRHRSGASGRRCDNGGGGGVSAAPHQRADDSVHGDTAGGIRRGGGPGVRSDPADLPPARGDQRRGYRPAHRVSRRHSRGQGIPRRGARGPGVRARGGAHLRQRAQLPHRHQPGDQRRRPCHGLERGADHGRGRLADPARTP